jgi:hypothetical protein
VTITASGFVDTDNVAADQRAVRIPGRATLAGARRDEAFSRRARAQVLFTNAMIACLPEKEGGGAPIAPTQRSPACGGGRGGGSPHGAPRRRLPKRPNASAQPGPRFTRRRGRRRYPRRRSRLSAAPRAPVVVPEGSMPEPPEDGVTSPARRNRTRSINRPSPVTSLERAGIVVVT